MQAGFGGVWRVGIAAVVLSCGGRGGGGTATEGTSDDGSCTVGTQGCPCTSGGLCDPGLECIDMTCLSPGGGSADASGDATAEGDGTSMGSGASEAGTGDASTSGMSGTMSGGSTSAGDASGGATSGSSTGAIEPCETLNPTLTSEPPNLMFVLDQSGSMTSETWDHDGNPGTSPVTRWNTLHAVVSFIVDTYEDRIDFGAKLFPTVDGCVVNATMEVEVAPLNADEVKAGMPPANATLPPGALTPPEQGVAAARAYLAPLDPGKARSLMLVMDGNVHPNCGTPAALEAELAMTYQLDAMPTYVVGIDLEPQLTADMNSYAAAGGVPKPGGGDGFYNAVNMLELQDAMDAIAADVLSCVIDLNPEPDFPDLTKVIVDTVEYPKVGDCASEDGWLWTTQFSQIELCGAACDAFKTVEAAVVEYYCM